MATFSPFGPIDPGTAFPPFPPYNACVWVRVGRVNVTPVWEIGSVGVTSGRDDNSKNRFGVSMTGLMIA